MNTNRQTALTLTCMLSACLAISAYAAPLKSGRVIKTRSADRIAVAVAQNEHIYVGSLVCISNTLAYSAADVAGYTLLGFAENEVDQTGDSYDASRMVIARQGTVQVANGGGYTLADVGTLAYIADNQTVTTAVAVSNDVPAGIIFDVDDGGVWIDIGNLGRVLTSVDADTLTDAGTATLTATNGPSVTSTTAPVWVTITVGSDNYVVPAYQLQ